MTASAALLVAATPLAHAAAAERPPPHVERFVFDSRFAAAMQAARAAAARGIPASGFAGDLTPLWYDDLDLEWRRRPMTLAGVTTREGLFVLGTLAADRFMRVTQRRQLADEGHVPLWSWIIEPRAAAFAA